MTFGNNRCNLPRDERIMMSFLLEKNHIYILILILVNTSLVYVKLQIKDYTSYSDYQLI